MAQLQQTQMHAEMVSTSEGKNKRRSAKNREQHHRTSILDGVALRTFWRTQLPSFLTKSVKSSEDIKKIPKRLPFGQ